MSNRGFGFLCIRELLGFILLVFLCVGVCFYMCVFASVCFRMCMRRSFCAFAYDICVVGVLCVFVCV